MKIWKTKKTKTSGHAGNSGKTGNSKKPAHIRSLCKLSYVSPENHKIEKMFNEKGSKKWSLEAKTGFQNFSFNEN